MRTTKRRAQADALAAYRNALVRNAPRAELERLGAQVEPSLRATIASMRADRDPSPRPEFVARLEQDLMHAYAHQANGGTAMHSATLSAPAPLVPSRSIVLRPARPLRQPWWQRGVSAIGVAALVIAMIGGVLFTYRGSHQDQLPAVIASPTANAVATPATPAAASVFLPPDATVGGLSLADWTARSQQWLLSFPSPVSPAFDLTGERCSYGQSGPVFYLLQSPAEFGASGTPQNVTRRCAVPLGAALLVPVLQAECSTAEAPPFFGRTETALAACVSRLIDQKPPQDLPKMAVTVDGQSAGDLTRYRAATAMYTLLLPPGNLAGASAPVADSMVDGYQLLLAPLAAGDHVVTITTPYAGGVHTVTYDLTVVAPPSAAPAATPDA